MRKTVSGLLLALLLAVVILPGRVSAAGNGFSGGTGTAEDPYQIATAEDLAAIPSGGASACYLQTADIDLSGTDDWKQITLSGTYDGGGYRILNFTSSTGGLFGTNSGTIRNVTMEGAKVSGNGLSSVGGLVNTNEGTVENCVFSGSVDGYCGSAGDMNLGGIVGNSMDKIIHCVVKAGSTITMTAPDDADDLFVGGITGKATRTVTNCLNEGTVISSADGPNARCGGIVGYGNPNYTSTSVVSGCVNTGDVIGPGKSLGGIIGYSAGVEVENCYNRGDIGGGESSANPVYPWKVNAMGGLAGDLPTNNSVDLRNSYSTGAVSGTESNSVIGTLIGRGDSAVGKTTMVTGGYWLEGSGLQPVGYYRKIALTACEELSQEEMQSLDMVAKLNQGLSTPVWYYDVKNINGGYPVLEWQVMDLCVQADVEPGMYVDPVTVTLTSPAGGQIWYTLDGSDPLSSASRSMYTGPVPVTADCTLKACAVYEVGNSPVSSFAYQVAEYPVRPNLEPGVYHEYITGLTLSCPSAPSGSAPIIYYTTDGSDPANEYNYGRKAFSGPIYFVETTTIRVVVEINGSYGDTLEYKYVISPEITASDPGGEEVYDAPVSVTLTSSLEQYDIYYTLDRSDPKQFGKLYEGPIGIGGTAQLKAVGRYGDSWGEVCTFSYTFPESVITAAPLYEMPENYAYYLKISCTPDYLDIYTDINGEFEEYTSHSDVPIYQTTKLTVQLRYGEQVVKTQTFSFELPELDFQVTPPTGVTYNSRITVQLNCTVYGIILRYSLDGSDPVLSSQSGISHPGQPLEIPLDRSCTLRVAAIWESKQEPILEKSYTYRLDIPGVKANYQTGVYEHPFELKLSITGASDPDFYQILYTTDGSDPMEYGQVYKEPIHVDRTVTIRAIPQFTLDKSFGTELRLDYTYYQSVSLGDDLTLYDDDGNYYVTAALTSNYPDPKQVEVWMGLYNSKGRMVDVKRLGEADLTAYQTTPVNLRVDYEPAVDPMDEAYDLRAFVLERGTLAPLSEVQTPERVVVPKLESITVGKGVYEVWLGAYGDYIQTTAHYTAGGEDKLLDGASCQYSSSNPDVAIIESDSGIIRFKQEGDAIITVTYTEGGRTATAYIYVKVSIPVYREHPAVPDFGAINHYSPYRVEDSGYVYDLPSDFSAIESYLRTLERMGFSYQPSISDPANGKVYYMTSRVGVQITMLDGSLYIIIVYNPYI